MLVRFKNCESCAPLTEINWLKFSFLPPCQFWPALSSYRAVVNLGSGERPNRLLGAFSTDVDMRSGTLRQRQSWTAVPSRWLVLAVVKAPDCAVLGQFLWNYGLSTSHFFISWQWGEVRTNNLESFLGVQTCLSCNQNWRPVFLSQTLITDLTRT